MSATNVAGNGAANIAAALIGTANQVGTYKKVLPEKASGGKETTTWGWVDGKGLVPNGGATKYAPIDTMKIDVNGQMKTLNAYPNMDAAGKKDAVNGPFQCTALVSSYLSDLNFKNAPHLHANGVGVAKELGTGANKEFFDYSSKGALEPKIGSIVSFKNTGKADDTVGHVAVVKGIEQDPANPNKLRATLIEQNFTEKGKDSFAVNREITFTKGSDGTWSSSEKDPGSLGYKATDWVTPKSLP